MVKHPYANEFKKAAEKEYRGLESKGTFTYCMNIFSYVHLPLFVYMRSPPTKYSLDPGPYLGPTYDYP